MSKAFEKLMSKGYRAGKNHAHNLLHHWSWTGNPTTENERVALIKAAGIATDRNRYRIDNPMANRRPAAVPPLPA